MGTEDTKPMTPQMKSYWKHREKRLAAMKKYQESEAGKASKRATWAKWIAIPGNREKHNETNRLKRRAKHESPIVDDEGNRVPPSEG